MFYYNLTSETASELKEQKICPEGAECENISGQNEKK